jgi:hypothetical protein
MPLYRDPIEGLVQYVNDIKPYHTKLIDVVVTYTYEERINVTILDNLFTTVTFNMDYSREPCFFGYDTDSYDYTAYNIPDYGYAINHANTYNTDCLLTGCERYYKTTTITPIIVDDTILLPFEYLYNIETLYVYINGVLTNTIFQQVEPVTYNDTQLDDCDRYNTNIIKCLSILPIGTRILITTHIIGVDNECWSDLASSGFESHQFDEHQIDLTDPLFDRWRYGYNSYALDATTYDMPDPDDTNRNCKCPPFIPYASPTSVLPTILEDIKFIDLIIFTDIINVTVFDWSDNWANGFDLTPLNNYRFDTTSLWDVIDNIGYNFGPTGRPNLIKTNFIIYDEQKNDISINITDSHTQIEIIDNDNENLGYDILPIDVSEFDSSSAVEVIAAATITDVFTVIEILEFKDMIGVNVVDPSCWVSAQGLNWVRDNFWYDMLPNLAGGSNTTTELVDDRVNWVQLPTVGGFECDSLGFDLNGFDNDQIWSCIPCSLVGGFDDSMGLDGYYDGSTYEPYENIPTMLGLDQEPLWNSYPVLPYKNDGTDFYHGCTPTELTDSIITIIRTPTSVLMSYIYYQTDPSTTWIITHNLSVFPIIRVFTLDGVEIHPASITHISYNTAVIEFSEPTVGIIRFV